VSLAAWFWGKILGRYIVIFLPVFGAMVLAVLIALLRGIEVPWGMFGYYTALLAVMAACFLGIGMLISALARSTDMAQGAAFVVWLTLLLFLDLILLGVMIQGKVSPEVAVTVALANPLQVFRTAALALFDPQLIVLGPSAYVILDLFGLLLAACAGTSVRGTGDLGLVIERASGHVTLVNTSTRRLCPHRRLGDLSHASVVYSRDARYAYVFGRDGGLTKVDLLEARIVKRVIQSGNAIGGSISQDGRIVVAQNYTPGGIKAFDAETLELLAKFPPNTRRAKFSKVVGLADVPGNKFAYALFDGGEIWVSDFSEPKKPVTQRYPAGQQPYDGLVTPDGRHYLAGLFGEDGVALLDLWQPEQGARKILEKYGKRRGKAAGVQDAAPARLVAGGGRAYLPAIGRHEVLVVDATTWQETGRIRSRASRCSSWPARRPPDLGELRLPRQRLGAGDRYAERQGGADAAAGQGRAAHGIHAARRGRLALGARRQPRGDLRHASFAKLGELPAERPPASSSPAAPRASDSEAGVAPWRGRRGGHPRTGKSSSRGQDLARRTCICAQAHRRLDIGCDGRTARKAGDCGALC
jgi:protein NirF